jgi:hypothetical protein
VSDIAVADLLQQAVGHPQVQWRVWQGHSPNASLPHSTKRVLAGHPAGSHSTMTAVHKDSIIRKDAEHAGGLQQSL